MYVERGGRLAWSCDRSIQTSKVPEHMAGEFSWDHPSFSGALEVVARRVIEGRPILVAYLFNIVGPGQVSQVMANSVAPASKRMVAI